MKGHVPVSKNSKLKTAERAENEQGYSSRPQAGKTRVCMIINRANIDPFPVEYIEEFKKQVQLRNDKESLVETSTSLRSRQATEACTRRLIINDERKQGQRRGKFRDAANVEAVELDMTADETNGMKVNQFTRKIKYIIEEILCRKYTSITLENDTQREAYRKELEKLDTVKGFKVHLRIILQIDVDGKDNKKTDFQIISANDAHGIINARCTIM